MTITLTRTGDTFTVMHGTTPVFTGSMEQAMREHSRLSLAEKAPVVTSPRKQAQLDYLTEKKSAGVR